MKHQSVKKIKNNKIIKDTKIMRITRLISQYIKKRKPIK